METTTMDCRKIQLAQFILGISDSALLNRISSIISDYKPEDNVEPCHYSLHEVQDRLRVCEGDAIAGTGVTQDEVDKDSLNWI